MSAPYSTLSAGKHCTSDPWVSLKFETSLVGLLTVLGGWICGPGRPADLSGVRRAEAEDVGDSGSDGRPGALSDHLLHLSR